MKRITTIRQYQRQPRISEIMDIVGIGLQFAPPEGDLQYKYKLEPLRFMWEHDDVLFTI